MIKYRIEKIDGVEFIFGYKNNNLIFLDISENEEFIRKNFKGEVFEKSRDKFPAITQVNEYFQRERKVFNLDISLKGTDFQIKTWKAISSIPFGKTKSYSEIAKDISNPKAYRAVGSAAGLNPIMIVIPCHRVTTKDYKITGFRGGVDLKKKLLDFENECKKK